MTAELFRSNESAAPSEKTEAAANERHRDLPAWSKLGEDSVPVRRKTGHAEAKERTARLRLIVARGRV